GVIQKRGAVREVLRTLEAKGWVAILADQNAGAGGTFVEFFGLLASTYATPAVLAARTGLPIYAAACIRRCRPPLTYEIHVHRLEPPPRGTGESEAAAHLLREFMASLETWIRRAPEQYNWVHRRWKHRPPGEDLGRDAPRYDHRVASR
ncbi:MAG: lysophospholipid acyltransferase family protein, partial [Planctomycetota bacterium]